MNDTPNDILRKAGPVEGCAKAKKELVLNLKLHSLAKWEVIARILADNDLSDEEVRDQFPSLTRGTCGYCKGYDEPSGSTMCGKEGGCPLYATELCWGGCGDSYGVVVNYRKGPHWEGDDDAVYRERALVGARDMCDAMREDIERE